MALWGAILMIHSIIHLIRMLLPDFKQMLFVAPFLLPLQQSEFHSLLSSSCSNPSSESLILREHAGWNDGAVVSKLLQLSSIVNKITTTTTTKPQLFSVCVCLHVHSSWAHQRVTDPTGGFAVTKHTAVPCHEAVKTRLVLLCPTCVTLHRVGQLCHESWVVFGLIWFVWAATPSQTSRRAS